MPARRARRPVVARLPRGGDRQAFLDAAYRLIDRAWVRLDERAGAVTAALTPRAGPAARLREEFQSGYESARALRRTEREDRAPRAAALSRALALAERVDARRRAPAPALTPERRAEIARLLAEDAASARDPLGLRAPWKDPRRGGAGA